MYEYMYEFMINFYNNKSFLAIYFKIMIYKIMIVYTNIDAYINYENMFIL